MNTKDITYISLFCALTVILGIFPMFTIPGVSIPITAQSMGPMIAACALGAKRGFFSVLLFILMVGIGLPFLTGGRGGILYITTSPYSGYIYGWAIGAFITGYLIQKTYNQLNFINAFIYTLIGGIIVVYLFGISWYSYIAKFNFFEAVIQNLAFIPGDLIKASIAAQIAII